MEHPVRGAVTSLPALLVALVIVAAIAAAAPPPAAATMVTESYSAYSPTTSVGQPDIDGDHVVWAGKNSHGVWKVGFGTLDTTANTILPWPSPASSGAQTHPAVSGNWIVWQDHRNGNWDIYARNYLAPGTDVALCTAKGDQTLPRIFGTDVVWQDHRGSTWDIYSQNAGSPVGNGTPVVTAKGDQTAPDIDSGRIVWADTRSGNSDIWVQEPGPSTRALVTNAAKQDQPTLSGHRVVWRDFRKAAANGTDLYLYDFSTSKTKAILSLFGNQSAPRLSDDMVVYNDGRQAAFGRRSYGVDIGFYDITLMEDFDVVSAKGDQKNPAIWGGTVLWADGGVPATKPDSLHAAELTFWSAFVGINGYSRWTNDPVCTLDLYAAYKLSEVPQTITQMTVSNVGAFGPFPLDPYVETVIGWNLNGGLADTDGLKQVRVVYRDAGADISPAAIGEITLDRDSPGATAVSPVTCRSGGTAKIKYKVDDTLSPKVRATILIRDKANTKTLKTLACGWQPVGAWKYRTFMGTLKPGSYHFMIETRDLAGNTPGLLAVYDLKVTK